MKKLNKIAFGGGCHWCTEAVFQSLIGVELVEQGFVASLEPNESFSEAVIVHFDQLKISLKTLIAIHLHTHKSASSHSMREKYRSAIYAFNDDQMEQSNVILKIHQNDFGHKLITKVLPFSKFQASRESIQNYYENNPDKPFCKTFINPKLRLLMKQFSSYVKDDKIEHLCSLTNQYQA